MQLVMGADASELASLEEVIGELVRQKLLRDGVLRYCWHFADPSSPRSAAPAPKVHAALSLLAMAAKVRDSDKERRWRR